MKKMGILAAALACVTVGGVYATWNYAGTANVPLKIDETTLTLTDVHKSGEYGSYSIKKSDNFKMVIDSAMSQGENVDGVSNHKAILDIEGSITITFTPNDTASEAVKANGIETKFFFAASGGLDTWKCDDPDTVAKDSMDIFTSFDTTEHIIKAGTTATGGDWTKEGDAFTYTITDTQLQNYFTLSDITLDTYEKYETFRDDLVGKNIVLTVNDTTGQADNSSSSSSSDASDSDSGDSSDSNA